MLAQDAQLPLMESYDCQSCGAQIDTPTGSVIQCCPFCGNNLGTRRQLHKHFVPEYILPFHIAKASLCQRLTEWNQHRTNPIQTVDGIPALADTSFLNIQAEPVYLPYWLFIRSNAEAPICSIPLSVNKRVSASIPAILPHYSGARFPRQETYVLEPWPTQNLLPFNTAFIRKIAVESPQWHVKDAWNHFQDSVAFMELYLQEYGINTDIQQTAVEFDLQSFLHPQRPSTFRFVRWKELVDAQHFQIAQALLPVWICHLPGDNPQRVFVNGASGEIIWDPSNQQSPTTLAEQAHSSMRLVMLLFFFMLLFMAAIAIPLPSWLTGLFFTGFAACSIYLVIRQLQKRPLQRMSDGDSTVLGEAESIQEQVETAGRSKAFFIQLFAFFFGPFCIGFFITIATQTSAFAIIGLILSLILTIWHVFTHA